MKKTSFEAAITEKKTKEKTNEDRMEFVGVREGFI